MSLIDSSKSEIYILLGMEGIITGLAKKLWFPKLKPNGRQWRQKHATWSNKRHDQTNRGNNQTKVQNKVTITNYSCNFAHLVISNIYLNSRIFSGQKVTNLNFYHHNTDANFNSSHLILCLGKKKISPSAQTKMTPGGAHHYTIWLTFIIPVWK